MFQLSELSAKSENANKLENGKKVVRLGSFGFAKCALMIAIV